MYSLGIDIGYSSVKASLMRDDVVLCNEYSLHRGNIKQSLSEILERVAPLCPAAEGVRCSVTGSGSGFIADGDGVSRCNEVSALVEGASVLCGGCASVIEIGGEGAKFVTGFDGADRTHLAVAMNSNCSAGTGSFLEEQVSRLNIRLEEYSAYAARAAGIPRIAGRCSVFAKTDITHCQQEGVPVEDILLGLAYALVRNYRASVIRQLPVGKPVFFAGGVAFNGGIFSAMREVLKLGEGDLLVSPDSGNTCAIGAAILAREDGASVNPEELLRMLRTGDDSIPSGYGEPRRLPMLRGYGSGDANGKHVCVRRDLSGGPVDCYIGVDVGSTSTNVVCIDTNDAVLAHTYVRTLGNPSRSLQEAFSEIRSAVGDSIRVVGAGVTGSGRYMIGEMIGADVIKDEITAQARAAAHLDEDVDTVFEIGGQDSKFISLKQGAVTDFQMNKVCAAGTGSFIEEQSKKFGVPIDEFGGLALASTAPIGLGERCTVFIETSVAAHLARGAAIGDIAAGLCYSIVRNYLSRVVGKKKIGNRIFLQGGIAFNQGVVNAFRLLTGKDVRVPPFFSVTGAYGAAMLAREGMTSERTRFRGLDALFGGVLPVNAACRTDTPPKKANRFDERVNALIFEGYDGQLDEGKKTVGIPRALFTYGMYPMFSAFFRELGFNVLLSDPTSERTVRLGQEYAQDEICYPIKLVTGHVAELLERKPDYIFFPDLHSVMHPGSQTRQDYGCAYMQLAFKLVQQAMGLSEKGIALLAPTIAFNHGPEFMKRSFGALGGLLGRTPEETARALGKGMEAVSAFEKRLQKSGEEAMSHIGPSGDAFVIISKIYGVADPLLNMGIPGKLEEMGFPVLPFFDLPGYDCSGEHPNMYWPFGQHILETAAAVRERPNMHAIFLTHHCCGPDSVLTHYFREIMGEKLYLNIEVDEHASAVGVLTRLEAFINSLGAAKQTAPDPAETPRVRTSGGIPASFDALAEDVSVCIPHLFPYSSIFATLLERRGIRVSELPETDRKSLDEGRSHTLTNEYLSLTGLLGCVFRRLRENPGENVAFLVPQTEGAEVDGQYARLLRTMLDEKGHRGTAVIAPFIEDLSRVNVEGARELFMCLLAGDVVNCAPRDIRDGYLDRVLDALWGRALDVEAPARFGAEITEEWRRRSPAKTVLAVGEPCILYSDFLNNGSFGDLERNPTIRVAYAPLGECLWLFWSDTLALLPEELRDGFRGRLACFEQLMASVSEALGEYSPFARTPGDLVSLADRTVGLYCGAFGRYRSAKAIAAPDGVRGVISVASLYENTAVLLNSLHKGRPNGKASLPILNLAFDGNPNENDVTKLESFIHYLQ